MCKQSVWCHIAWLKAGLLVKQAAGKDMAVCLVDRGKYACQSQMHVTHPSGMHVNTTFSATFYKRKYQSHGMTAVTWATQGT